MPSCVIAASFRRFLRCLPKSAPCIPPRRAVGNSKGSENRVFARIPRVGLLGSGRTTLGVRCVPRKLPGGGRCARVSRWPGARHQDRYDEGGAGRHVVPGGRHRGAPDIPRTTTTRRRRRIVGVDNPCSRKSTRLLPAKLAHGG